jgi:phosphoserine phosphatase
MPESLSAHTPAPTDAPNAERQLQDLQSVLHVARALAGTLDLDSLLTQIVDALRQVLAAERTTLFLYDDSSKELFSRISRDLKEVRFPADRGIAGAAAQSRKTINIPNAYADSRFNPDIDRQTGYHTRCILAAPLIGLDNQLVGVVQALNKSEGVFSQYDEQLAEALAAQAGVAIQRAALIGHYLRKKEIEENLRIARQIQQKLLPKAAPKVPGYDIGGWCQPADETGGDCFDFFVLPNGRVAISVADVTGHGVGPALVMAETRALLRVIAGHVDRPEKVLARANAMLCEDLSEGRFVTTFFGLHDAAHHVLEYASAGHGPLFWYRAATRKIVTTGSTGVPLGFMDPLPIAAGPPFAFEPGDMAVLLTDGFPEARGAEDAFFGEERLRQFVMENAQLPAQELISRMAAEVHAFRGAKPQLDDWTAVVVKRLSD